MAAPTTAEEALLQNALGPKQAMVGKTQITAHDLSEIAAIADRERANTAVDANDFFGIRFAQFNPPGAG